MSVREVYSTPVWECGDCGTIFHKEPAWTQEYKFKVGGYFKFGGRRLCLCPECGGDVHRAHDRVPLARSVRPVPSIKGQKDFAMWRYCCWNCGKASEIAQHRRWRWSWNRTGAATVVRVNTSCHFCGKENRLIIQEG